MPDDLLAFGGRDAADLTEMIDEWRSLRHRQPTANRQQQFTASRVPTYLGLTTTAVSARVGTLLGSGTVRLYSADENSAGLWRLTDSGIDETAYNPCTAAIASGTFVQLYRDGMSGRLLAVGLCPYVVDSGTGSGGPASCSVCPAGAPSTFCVSFLGVTNNGCTSCSVYTGTVTLTHVGGCVWQVGVDPCGTGGANSVTLYGAVGNWILRLTDHTSGYTVEYTATGAGWDCNSALTMTRGTASTIVDCSGFPATVSLAACSGGGGGSGITITGIDKKTSAGSAVSSITSNTLTTSTGLVVAILAMTGVSTSVTATFNGNPMTPSSGITLPLTAAQTGLIKYFYAPCGTGGGQSITATLGSGSGNLQMIVVNLTNLPNDTPDKTGGNRGSASAPDTGTVPTSGSTTYADEAVVAAALLETPGAVWTWGGGFTSVGEDLSDTVGVTPVSLTVAGKVLSATGTVDASLSGVTPADWAACAETFS